jgi:sec-independent protein translocase protein TatA
MAGLDNPIHLLFLLVLVLLVFGAKRLPEMGRSLGSGLRGFKDALSTDVSQQAALEQGTTLASLPPRAPAVNESIAASGEAGAPAS